MARLARMVVPGVPHHVTQRGNRRERIFFEVGDEQIYLDLMTGKRGQSHLLILSPFSSVTVIDPFRRRL